ncbi:unnamed protein product [Lepidochelys kempii]
MSFSKGTTIEGVRLDKTPGPSSTLSLTVASTQGFRDSEGFEQHQQKMTSINKVMKLAISEEILGADEGAC